MKITRGDTNPYQQQMAKPSELLAEAQKAARRRGTTVERRSESPEAKIKKRPERDPQSAKYKAEATRRELERRPEFPSQFIDKTI